MTETRRIKLVDLFCGAGGLSLGLQQAGMRTIYAADFWTAAVATYRQNLGNHVHELALDESTSLPEADVYAGGPPCQGFSSAGRRVANDERNSLVRVFANLVATHRPRAFVFENVEGFLTTDRGRFVVDLLEPLVEAGYCIHLRKVNAANYGVPQHRKRVIAIGALGWDPGFPDPTHRAYGAPGSHLCARMKSPAPTIREAISDLPAPATEPPGDPHDHYYRPLDGEDLERARYLQPGQRMRDLPERLQHQSYRKRAFRRVCDGMPTDKRGGAPAGIRRLVPDEPSKAITGAALRDFIHYDEHRPLTLRECARIQTFPDEFIYTGTTADRAQQIGNSVPVKLASVIGRHLLDGLLATTETGLCGQLLSFVPTASEGMSPSLQEVCNLVARRFSTRRYAQQELMLWQV